MKKVYIIAELTEETHERLATMTRRELGKALGVQVHAIYDHFPIDPVHLPLPLDEVPEYEEEEHV